MLPLRGTIFARFLRFNRCAQLSKINLNGTCARWNSTKKFNSKQFTAKIPPIKDLLNPRILARFVASNGVIIIIYEVLNIAFAVIFYKLFQLLFGMHKTEEQENDSFLQKKIHIYLEQLQRVGIIGDQGANAGQLQQIGKNLFYTIIMLKIFMPVKMLLSVLIFIIFKRLVGFKIRKV